MKKIVMGFFLFGILFNTMAQKKFDLAELDIDQLNLYLEKAIKMRNTGMAFTIAGVSVCAVSAGLLFDFIIKDIRDHDPDTDQTPGNIYMVMMICGAGSAAAGIPLMIVGNNKKTSAEIALKKFDLKTDNSTAVGFGLTFRF
jgi:hypothetical protein